MSEESIFLFAIDIITAIFLGFFIYQYYQIDSSVYHNRVLIHYASKDFHKLKRKLEELEKELKIEKLEKEKEIEKLKRILNGTSNTNNAN